ncbi:hypothetical protein HDU93_008134 [Gonapodya sp. JEL0774]|nr:hypothetical protein HDU93_008134 [Gonapodya sp. JEL0774]
MPSSHAFLDRLRPFASRSTYQGAVLFNLGVFLIPAIYSTLSKLWIANIDSSMVATTDAYTYLGVFAEVLNEGLPRAAYLVIGDTARTSADKRSKQISTLLIFQMCASLVLSVVFLCAAPTLTAAFVPPETRNLSITYLRISSFSTFFVASSYAIGTAFRAIDRPDVPLVVSTTSTIFNIILDLLFLSKIRVVSGANVNTQATVRLVCDMSGAVASLLYFTLTLEKGTRLSWWRFGWTEFKELVKPGAVFFAESAANRSLESLDWRLITGIVALGNVYATAWGVFNTIRWGLVMVPSNSLEASSSTFVGHAWSQFRKEYADTNRSSPTSSRELLHAPSDDVAELPRLKPKKKLPARELYPVVKYAVYSGVAILVVELILLAIMSAGAARQFAYYLTLDLLCQLFGVQYPLGLALVHRCRAAWAHIRHRMAVSRRDIRGELGRELCPHDSDLNMAVNENGYKGSVPPEAFRDVKIAIIGGTGLYQLENVKHIAEFEPLTPWGYPSSPIHIVETAGGHKVAFLARHGHGHAFTPTTVPAQANIAALKHLGVEAILAFSAVGSLKQEIAPRDFVIPDQIIDRTKGIRGSTFFGTGLVAHAMFGDPFDFNGIGQLVWNKCRDVMQGDNAKMHLGGTLICMEGPAFSTRAESNLYRSWGGSVINMSAIPEAKLAREAEIAYQMICMSTDYDCWHEDEEPVTVEMVMGNVKANGENARRVVEAVLPELEKAVWGRESTYVVGKGIKGSMKYACMTSPAKRDQDLVRKLEYILPGY